MVHRRMAAVQPCEDITEAEIEVDAAIHIHPGIDSQVGDADDAVAMCRQIARVLEQLRVPRLGRCIVLRAEVPPDVPGRQEVTGSETPDAQDIVGEFESAGGVGDERSWPASTAVQAEEGDVEVEMEGGLA